MMRQLARVAQQEAFISSRVDMLALLRALTGTLARPECNEADSRWRGAQTAAAARRLARRNLLIGQPEGFATPVDRLGYDYTAHLQTIIGH